MTVTHQPEPVAGILRDMAGDAGVRGQLVHAARTHSPDVARLGEAETLRHVTAIVAAAGPWLGTFGGVDGQDFAAALLLGTDRAEQGVPITSVLRGVQAALTRTVEIAVDRSRSAGVPDGLLLSAVLRLKEYGDAVERHVINGYRTAEQELPSASDGLRARLLRRILTGGVPPAAGDLARAGLRPGGRYHCLVADGHDAAGARRLADAIAALRGIAARVEGRPAGLLPRMPASGEFGPEAAGGLVVLSPAVPLDQLPPVHRLCVRAVTAGGRRGRRGVRELTDFAGEIATAEQPLLGSFLAGELLGTLDPADAFHRQLALTALAFLEHGRRLDQTAAALFTHPNTVRYRLGRLRQITGEPPADATAGPLDALHWWWALTTWLGPDRGAPLRE
ncbi:helix-turn-helix domain-containing protein [Actinacidiphila glaucinigra]|uniref:helix-turn-helix domain-containing protein n=1 Tax=Actinacidiphila glaucinigra TaxID=235986 RepID=UPI002DDA4558|nr:helix-turn-helix domain-containing protein [Actinacidiphila glaucinigra]WSD58439.1 helix-turn-helix domain-containing protein [Actinacidiphila glaucinigra]